MLRIPHDPQRLLQLLPHALTFDWVVAEPLLLHHADGAVALPHHVAITQRDEHGQGVCGVGASGRHPPASHQHNVKHP
jgi:hypothetical protein